MDNTTMKQFPPDPDGKNDERTIWAESAIRAFQSVTGTDREDALADLLCDLMHWADREPGTEFEPALSRARDHYYEETLDDGFERPEEVSEYCGETGSNPEQPGGCYSS